MKHIRAFLFFSALAVVLCFTSGCAVGGSATAMGNGNATGGNANNSTSLSVSSNSVPIQ